MIFQEFKISDFLEELSSKSPAPGGGTASALMGALGVSLLCMVCNLTIGKEKFKEKEPMVKEILEKAKVLLEDFKDLMDEDTEAFKKVSEALKMPKSTDEDKKRRNEALQQALKEAAETPFKIMEKVKEASKLLKNALSNTNPSAVTDLGVSALALKSSLLGAWLNVKINLKSIDDEKFNIDLQKKMDEVLTVEKDLNTIFEEIKSLLN